VPHAHLSVYGLYAPMNQKLLRELGTNLWNGLHMMFSRRQVLLASAALLGSPWAASAKLKQREIRTLSNRPNAPRTAS
jgi:hypothetical protein